jgi:DNA-binding transcriptional MerR regulator
MNTATDGSTNGLRPQDNIPIIRDYNTIKEAAAIWRITERQVRYLRKEGELPEPITRGSQKLYTREQIEWVKRRDHIRAGFIHAQ